MKQASFCEESTKSRITHISAKLEYLLSYSQIYKCSNFTDAKLW